jgi:predicted component of type VI protein secretion system
MMDYGIGGQEKKGNDANEAISDIQKNRTMLVQKLTADAPFKPKIEEKLETVDAVFARYKPQVDLEFEDAEGTGVDESLRFANLGDFGKKGITAQSPFLQDLSNQQDDYQKYIKQLKSNKVLQKILADPAAKEAYLTVLRAMVQELEDANA